MLDIDFITDHVRLEVEQEPEGLTNLVQNPSGELGGFGWVTPVAGSVLVSAIDGFTGWLPGLRYTTAASAGGNYFQSDPFDVAASEWVAAFWHVNYTPYGDPGVGYRVRIDWYNSSDVALTPSAWTTYSDDYVDANFAPVLAPASTAYGRIRFEVAYDGDVFPHTFAGHQFSVRDVTVSKAGSSGGLGTFRTNLVKNPSFETNTTGWTGGIATLARVTTQSYVGSASLRLTSTSGGTMSASTATGTSGMAVMGSRTYTFQVRTKASTVARSVAVSIKWYNASGTAVGTTITDTSTNSTSDWTLHTVQAFSPLSAAYAAVQVGFVSVFFGEVHYVDAALFEYANSVNDYFDGATTDAPPITYNWTGTAHASTSTYTNSNLSYIEPITWVDILGDTHEISVTREELNVGTLAAKVVNPDLDPAIEETLHPGRRFRLTALNPTTGDYEPLIVGRLLAAKTDYQPLNRNGKTAIVTLSGTDAITSLANAVRPDAVGTIDELPYVLEGAGVPWNVNGSGQQVPTADVIVSSDGATALDRVALARETELGFAWLDRYGVLQAWNVAPASDLPIPNASFDDPINTIGWSPAANCTVQSFAGNPHSPRGYMGMTATVGGSQMDAQSDTGTSGIPIAPNAEYTIRGWSRAQTTGRSATIMARWYDEAGAFISTTGPTVVTNTTSWTEYESVVTSPANAAYMAIAPRVQLAAAGEIHFWDSFTVNGPPGAPLDEDVYNENIVIDFDTDRAINSVSVLRQWTHPTEGPQGTLYGPFTDDTSIAEWGRKHVEVNVAGTDPGDIPDYADLILAANSEPQVLVRSLQVPILDDARLAHAFTDLYDLVRVVNTDTAIDTHMRVTQVSHSITADQRGGKWLMELGFAADGGVATPVQQPAVRGVAVVPNGTLVHLTSTSTSSLTHNTFEFIPGFGANATYFTGPASGVVTFTVAGTYLVNLSATIASNTTGRRMVRLLKNGTEVRRADVGSGGQVTVQVSHVVTVAVGDTLTAQAFQSSGGALALGASPGHDWQFVRIGD